uniref:Uncharacterized protein n=1 Tax=Ditylenchus dipsaci TaxID=166011 RepID=A0A915CNC1_9BILA
MGALQIIWAIGAIFLIGSFDNTANAFAKSLVKSRKLEVSQLLSQLASSDINAFHDSNDQIANGKSVLSSSSAVIGKVSLEQLTYAAIKSLCSFYHTAEHDQNANRPLSFSQKKASENNF